MRNCISYFFKETNSSYRGLLILSALSLIFRAFLPFQTPFALGLILLFFIFWFKTESFPYTFKLFKNRREYFLFAGVSFFAFLGALVSIGNTEIEVKELFRIASTCLIFVAYYLLSTKFSIQSISTSFAKYFIIYTILAIIYSALRISFEFNGSFQLFANNTDLNMLAMYSLMASVVVVYFLFIKKVSQKRVIVYNLILGLLFIVIAFSASRRGILFYAIFIICLMFLIYFKKYQKYFTYLMPYLSFLVVVLTFFLLAISSNNFREFLLIHQDSKEEFASRIERIGEKYATFTKKNPHQLTFFSNNKIMFAYAKHKYENDDPVNWYKHVYGLAFFSKSREQLNSIVPQAKILPDSLFCKPKINNLPATYNIDYSFRYCFVPIGFGNCVLSDFIVQSDDYRYIFNRLDPNEPSKLLTLLPLSDSSVFKLKVEYEITEKEPRFELNKFDGEIVNNNVYDLNDSIRVKEIEIGNNSYNRSTCWFHIIFEFDTLKIYNISWQRKQKSNHLVYSPISFISNRQDYLKKIKSIVEIEELKSKEPDIDELLDAQKSFIQVNKLINYTRVEIDSSSNSFAKFSTIGKKGGIMKIVPTIQEQTYVVEFKTNIPPHDLNYWIGRYPQVEPYTTVLYYSQLHIDSLKENLYQVIDTFKVKKCNSLRSSLVILSEPQRDSLLVRDFSYTTINPVNNISINKLQNKGYNKILESVKRNFDIVTGQEGKLIRDSLSVHYGLDFKDFKEDLFGTRFLRYRIAYIMFKDYSPIQKLIGNGMNYCSVYGKIFYDRSKLSDYPHNPIISAFLYSGIIGGVLYLWFLVRVFMGYYKRREEFGIVSLMFLISFVFAFFSGNSHFSIPVFAILSFFPYLPVSHKE
ncbi:MAG: hypothetical protein AB7E36_03395 [Salinivirgaceae bacterium]